MQDTVTKERNKYIGGSDIPAIMGISPFTTRFDLLKYKAGFKENDFNGNEYTEYGNEMEPIIRKYVNDIGNASFEEDKIVLDDSNVLPIRYHADGVDKKACSVLEIKTTSRVCAFDGYKKYLVQLLCGMKAFGYEYGILAVYARPEDMSLEFDASRLQIFEININDYDETLEDISDAIKSFREDYQYLLQNPFADEAELPSRYALIPFADKLMQLETSIKQAQEIVAQYDDMKKQLCKAMQEHGIKSWTMPNGTKATLVEKGKDKEVQVFNESKFKEEHGDLYEQYTESKTKNGRSAYIRLTPMA